MTCEVLCDTAHTYTYSGLTHNNNNNKNIYK